MKKVATATVSAPKFRHPRPDSESARGKDAINAAIALFHRRWLLRVLWELRTGPQSFRALQEACGDLSPTVLNARLHELRDVAWVSHEAGTGYALTKIGEELLIAMRPLATWCVRWHVATK